MNPFLVLAVTAIAILCSAFAYELCYTVTVFGGHLPFLVLTTAAPIGYMIGTLDQSET